MIPLPTCYNAGDVIPIFFDTYAKATGASITMSGLAKTDIEIYKGTSMTQRASDNGYELVDTDGIDIDGVTGLHGFYIDTSDNSDDGFWADGNTYHININAITVDGETVRFTYMLALGYTLRPTTAGRKLDVSAGGEAGIDWNNIGSPTTTQNLSGTTTKTVTDVEAKLVRIAPLTTGTCQTHAGNLSQCKLASGETIVSAVATQSAILITGGTGAGQLRYIQIYDSGTKIATVPHFNIQPDNTSTYAIFPASEFRNWHATDGDNQTMVRVNYSGQENILDDYANDLLLWCDLGGRVIGDEMGGADYPYVGDGSDLAAVGVLACNEDGAKIPSAAEVNAEADAAIETYGLDHLVAAAVSGSDVADNSALAKLVSKEATADWDDFVNTTDSLQAIRDNHPANFAAMGITAGGLVSLNTFGTGGQLQVISLVEQTLQLTGVHLRRAQCQAGSTSSTIVLDASASAQANAYVNCLVSITSGTGAGQIKPIASYDESTKTATISGTWTTTPDGTSFFAIVPNFTSGDSYAIVNSGTYGNAAIKTLIDALDTVADSILAAINSAQAEPGQGAPAANATPLVKLAYLYKAWRNKTIQTEDEYQLHNDAGDTIDQKASVSDDGSEYTRDKVGTGA